MSGTRKSADRWSTDCAWNVAQDSPTEVRDACACKIGAVKPACRRVDLRVRHAGPMERNPFSRHDPCLQATAFSACAPDRLRGWRNTAGLAPRSPPMNTRRSRDNARIANMRRLGILLATCTFLCAQIPTGPPLPYCVVEGWPQLPAGWNFGEVAAVDGDTNDNVCAGVKGEDRRARACSAGACRRVYRAAVGSAIGSPRLDGSWERVGALGNCCHWREPSFRKLPGPTVLEPGRGRLRQPPIDQFCMSALLSSTNRLLRLM